MLDILVGFAVFLEVLWEVKDKVGQREIKFGEMMKADEVHRD